MTRSIKRLKGIATQILLVMTVLTAVKGVNNFCGHTEKYYNLPMRGLIHTAKNLKSVQKTAKSVQKTAKNVIKRQKASQNSKKRHKPERNTT